MDLHFHNSAEFEDFAYLYMLGQQAHSKGHRLELKAPATVIGELVVHARVDETSLTDIVGEAMDDAAPEAADDDGVVHEHIDLPPADEREPQGGPAPEAEKPKRKRRTKAEIAADEAAAAAAANAVDEPEPEAPVEEPQPDEGAQPDAVAPASEPVAAAQDTPAVTASPESLKAHTDAQAAYTPELIEQLKAAADLFDADRKAHLDEGRKAIEKKGFIAYMATFKGLGLSSAIATYNDDEVKLHRAAIAHLLDS